MSARFDSEIRLVKYLTFNATVLLRDDEDPEPIWDKLFDAVDELCEPADENGDHSCRVIEADGRVETEEQMQAQEEQEDRLYKLLEELKRRERKPSDQRKKRRNPTT